MKYKKLLRNTAGFTLIELMVTLAVLPIAIALIFTMLSFGTASFTLGENTAQKQYEVRMASDFITKQLRYANSITFVQSEPAADAGHNDIYLKDVDGIKCLQFRESGVSKIPPGLSEFKNVKLIFNSFTNGIIEFTVGDTTDSKYDIHTKVILLNYVQSTSITIPSSCIGVSYSLPTSAISNPVTQIIVNGEGGATAINNSGGTLQMHATVSPSDASVTWSASNSNASISSTGLLKAEKNGTVVVTATANDGSGTFGTETITISGQVNPLTLNTPLAATGDTYTYTATASGGTSPYTYDITVTHNDGDYDISKTNETSATNDTITWTLDGTSPSLVFSVIAVDANGYTVSTGATVTKPLALKSPASTVPKGHTYSYTAEASGGTGGYVYSIELVDNNDGGTVSTSPNTITWNSPNGNGKVMKFTVTVTDSAGNTLTESYKISTVH